jgi:hypothetical protein
VPRQERFGAVFKHATDGTAAASSWYLVGGGVNARGFFHKTWISIWGGGQRGVTCAKEPGLPQRTGDTPHP